MKKLLLYLFLVANTYYSYSQLKVGTNPNTINQNANFQVESTNNNQFIITRDSSKVGIGTLSPTNSLHILSSFNPLRLEGLQSGNVLTDSILVTDFTGVIKRISKNSLPNSSYIEPWFNVATGSPATSNTQSIYQMGGVGIATSTPQTNLDIAPSSGSAGINVATAGTVGSDQAFVTFCSKYNRTSSIGSASNLGWQLGVRGNSWANISNKNSFHFSYWNGTNWSENITILPNGNLGIGNSLPAAKLDVLGSVKIVDGTQGAGKVLTSDANGNASWQSTSVSKGSLFGMFEVVGTNSTTVNAGTTIDVPGVIYTHIVPSNVTSQTIFISAVGYAPNHNGDANGGQGTFNLLLNNNKISSAYYAVSGSPNLTDLPASTTLIKTMTLTPGTYTFKISCSSWANTAVLNHIPSNYVGYNGDTEAMKTRMTIQIFNN